jgi:hypothetical protein
VEDNACMYCCLPPPTRNECFHFWWALSIGILRFVRFRAGKRPNCIIWVLKAQHRAIDESISALIILVYFEYTCSHRSTAFLTAASFYGKGKKGVTWDNPDTCVHNPPDLQIRSASCILACHASYLAMPLPQFPLSCVVGLVLYAVWSRFFARNPLDDIPGPPRQHWCTGKCTTPLN